METEFSTNHHGQGVQRLRSWVQNYDWGKVGNVSQVARLCSLNSGCEIEEDSPYAELWMGTHKCGPSFVVVNGDGELGVFFSLTCKLSENQLVKGEFPLLVGCGIYTNLIFVSLFSVMIFFSNSSFKKRILNHILTLNEIGLLICYCLVLVFSGIRRCLYCKSSFSCTHFESARYVSCLACKSPNFFILFLQVLSVAKALSIQAHPDKESAKLLNKLQPDLYEDDNHKPEMALATTEFRALCGFISLEELKEVLCDVPEITELVGNTDANQLLKLNEQNDAEKVKSVLTSIFTHLMSASKEMTIEAISKLKHRLYAESQVRHLKEKEQLILLLEKQYPGDIGSIAAFLFNYVKLNPGEALYLGANEPHAYLSGNCIECMATSNNVVRAGLTPKHRDIQTLCSMLTYKQGFPEILKGFSFSPYITRYLPPFDEFEVDFCILPRGASTSFPSIPGPSLFLVTVGKGTMYAGSFEEFIG